MPDLKPFTEAAKKGKWIILTSDDEREVEKKSGKENKFDHKKMKLVTTTAPPGNPDAENLKLDPDVGSVDSDDDAFSRHDSDSESVKETSCWRVFPASLGVDAFGDGDARSVDSGRRRFVLKKQSSKNK